MMTGYPFTPQAPGGRRKAVAAVFAAVAILGAGIGVGSALSGDTNSMSGSPPAAVAVPKDSGDRPAGSAVAEPGGAPTSTGRAVPKPLADVEAQAEDIVDKVAVGDWAAVRQDVATMRADWTTFGPTSTSAGVPAATTGDFTTALDRLGVAAAAQDAAGTAQAANDASAATVEMLGRYDLGHPLEIGRLDVIGRQVVIDAGAGDFGAASAQIRQAEQQLAAAQPSLAARGGEQVLTQTRATLIEMQRLADARNADALATQAKVLLEVVDGMERLYG